MINNRQNGGRRRGRGGPRPQGNPGQSGGGNRIDSRARGNAQQLHEKYKNLARDAQMAGDRVATEYYLQFADHYFRVLSESRARFEEQRPQRGNSDDEFEGEDGGDEYDGRDQRQGRERGDRNNYRRDEDRRDRAPEQPQQSVEPMQAENEAHGEDGQRRVRRHRGRRPEAENSEQPETFDADRLPPAIAVDNSSSEDTPTPRRRGRRPRAEGANDVVEVPPAA